jgi:RNA 2',3'-cyclic 3'-phosphodiesterase
MDLNRVFIAINIPEDIKERLADHLPDVPSRRVPKGNMHMTLAFLGHRSEREIQDIIRGSQLAGKAHTPFRMTFERLSYGPSERNPRMIWALAQPSQELVSLQRDLAQFASENRAFSPHVTLARLIMAQFRLMEADERPQLAESLSLTFSVKKFEIMNSTLKKSGAQYTILQGIHL